jgi:glycosyltransferase involved in cell wall biosynthesis
MARSLHNKTGRKVVIFNGPREKTTEIDGVVYMPAGQMGNYLLENEPKVHIAWRHNMKVTNAPTYLWCHDLMAQGIENHANYKKVITLSPFAKSFLRGLFALPDEKLWVSRNGVTLDRFADISTIKKVPGKIIFSSSPDRGLDRVIKVLDEVVKTHPNIQLHCFYGFDNMMKMGKAAEVERFTKLINERPWVIMHGNISQKDLTRHMAESCVWLYPTNFLETFCITAVEAAICGAYPVVRDYGAVPQTLSGVPATIIEESGSDDELTKYVVAVKEALTHKWWEQMRVSPEKYSWDSVADEWIAEMQL